MAELLTEEQIKEDIENILKEDSAPEFPNKNVERNTRRVLLNQAMESRKSLQEAEAGAGTQTNDVDNWDPVLISMVRRSMPTLIANDLVGVQPMKGPTGLIFSLRAWYGAHPNASGADEAFVDEPDQDHTGPYSTNDGENLGEEEAVDTGDSGTSEDPVFQKDPWPEMSFDVDKKSVEAETRALKARYTNELAQDLRQIHSMDADTELSNILSAEVTAEINREIVNMIHNQAKPGAQDTSSPTGEFDMETDTDGRWFIERVKYLMVQINKESHKIARDTRRGLATWVLASPDVIGALEIAGFVDSSFNPGNITNAGAVGPTYVGRLAGRYATYIDPYATSNYVMLGYKGANEFDAGMYYAPYTALTWHRTVHPESMNPILGVKTRRGLTTNPFVSGNNGENFYYRKFAVKNL